MKWVLILGLASTLTLGASWSLLPAPATAPSDPGTSRDTAIEAREVEGIGYIEPVSETRKLMLRTGGVILRYHVKAGDRVRRGEPILELDNTSHRAEVEVARKQLGAIRAEAEYVKSGINPFRIKMVEQTLERLREKWRHTQAEARRSRRLLESRATSQQDYDAAETLRKQTEVEFKEQEAELLHLRKYVTPEQRVMQDARTVQAEANLRLAEERLRETKLAAPFDGTVLKFLKREGEGMSTLLPEPVVLFGDLSRLRVRAEIDERFVRHLAIGQKASVFGRNLGNKSYAGQVVDIERIMGDKTVFTRASSERKDLNVLQIVIEMESGFSAPVGLQVDVRIHP